MRGVCWRAGVDLPDVRFNRSWRGRGPRWLRLVLGRVGPQTRTWLEDSVDQAGNPNEVRGKARWLRFAGGIGARTTEVGEGPSRWTGLEEAGEGEGWCPCAIPR